MNSLSGNSNAATQMLVFSTDADPLRVMTNSPPFISGYKPLPNNVAGVNRNMVNSDRSGLLGYILPYPDMDGTDRARIYLGPRPTLVAEFDIGPYVNQLVPFSIPATILEQMFAAPAPMPSALALYFNIQRISGNDKNSPQLPLLYKPSGPGELDTRPELPNNQGLLPPNPSKTVIDKQVMKKGMSVTVPQYEHQAIGDVVYLAVGPRELTMPVTALGDLWFELTPEFLATLPNTDKVALTYEIWDIVENGSGWSSTVFLTLKPTEQLLTAPVIDQAEPGNPDNLKHDALNGETATVLLNEQFTAGDEVLLTIALSTAVGDRVERVLKVEVKNSTRSLRIDLENEFIQNGIRGSMILSYSRQRAGGILHSESYNVTISGLALPAPVPTIDEQKDDVLPADTPQAHVRIPTYWPLVKGATVRLYWQVTGADGVSHLYIFGQVIVDATQPVVFTVNSEYIARYESSPLTVLYKIENPEKPVVQSQALQVTVGKSEKPVIIKATDDKGVSLANGVTTVSTSITLTGTGTPDTQVDVHLNTGVHRRTADVGSDGQWSSLFSNLAEYEHYFTARPIPETVPISDPWKTIVKSEWTDHSTTLSNYNYNGWITHNAARSGAIRNHGGVVAFFNFTDQGKPDDFAGTVMYQDFDFLPGTYSFWMQACHIAESPNPGLVNPILLLDTGMVEWRGQPREVPKNGIWYDFRMIFTITKRRVARLYISNFQSGSNGNDFGIRNIRVVRDSGGGGGISSAPEALNEAPPYNGSLNTSKPEPQLVPGEKKDGIV
ncbi:Ig-like domain-containing protein [Pseudomonas sp. HLT2-19-2]